MFDRPRDSKKTWRRMMIGMVLLAVLLVAVGTSRPKQPADISDVQVNTSEAVHLSPEFAYGPVTYKTTVASVYYGKSFSQQVDYTMVDGLPIMEGDIVLPERITTAGTGVPNSKFYWPNRLVAWDVDPALPNQARITDAIKNWEEKTSIRFVQRTTANAKQYPNYVYFVPSTGCWSYVGMQGGKQQIGLADGCSTGNTIHEIGHAIGLWHEQSRIDRDDYVTILYENIIPSTIFNFDKHISDGMDIGDYDYASIMHYPRKAFSKNGEDTIVPKGDQVIGQRSTLSEADISSVEFMYKNVKVTTTAADTTGQSDAVSRTRDQYCNHGDY
jgi:astacin